jgi:hypothetical protein
VRLLADVVDGGHRWMVERGGSVGLTPEAGSRLRIVGQL